MSKHTRAEGWKFAKHSGHDLEKSLAENLKCDPILATKLHEDCFASSNTDQPEVTVGGINAKPVPSVLDDHTQPKVDLSVCWNHNSTAKISLKKSVSGQVWLISLDRFLKGFKAQFSEEIPEDVCRGLKLFIGPLSEEEMRTALGHHKPCGPVRKKDGKQQEFHQQRFVAKTLDTIIPDEWPKTLEWLRRELPRIVELCFKRGLCKSTNDHAEFIWWYPNESLSHVVSVQKLIDAIEKTPECQRVCVGPRNGGSTIILPFGFLQMHQHQLQFHHDLKRIKETLSYADSQTP